MSWIDRMGPGFMAEMRDAGRIGASRFEGPETGRVDYPEHDEDCVLNCPIPADEKCRTLHGCALCADLEDVW